MCLGVLRMPNSLAGWAGPGSGHLLAFAMARSFSSVTAKQAAQWEVPDSCWALRQVGKQATGRKCSIILQSTGAVTASPQAPVSDHGGFLQRACLHLSRLKQTLHYLAVLSDPSQESKLTDGRSLPLYEQEGRLVVVAWQRQRPGAGHSEMLAKSALLTQRSGRVLRDGKATRLTAPSHAFAAQITGDTAYVTPGTKSKQQCLTSLASSYVAAARLREFG